MLLALLGMLTALVNAHMPVGRPPALAGVSHRVHHGAAGAPSWRLFVLFPRMAPLWGVPEHQMVRPHGLSGSHASGPIAELALNDAVNLRIKFDSPTQRSPPPSSAFVGPVLSASSMARMAGRAIP